MIPKRILAPCAEEILKTVRLLMRPGDVHELRAVKVGRYRTVSGYFDSPEKLLTAALELERLLPPAIYITLNPCNPALLARANNRLKFNADLTTGDADILQRRFILIDFDPKRPSGISSTDYEHSRAIAAACGAWDDLRWRLGDPVLSNSGNGAHLLYRVDLPNTLESTELVKRTLAVIAATSAPADVEIDVSLFNAARITKLYGTVVRKGDSTPNRPHRLSRILEIP